MDEMPTEKCVECGGSGDIEIQDTGHFPWTCPSCHGLGYPLTAVERIREALNDDEFEISQEQVVELFDALHSPLAILNEGVTV